LVYGNRPLIICPAGLIEMWEKFNERYHLNARILSMNMLKVDENDKSKNILLDDFRYKDRDIVLIDESHNFRYPDTQRYRTLQPYLQTRKAIYLTATPRNKSAWDIYYQIKLFHPEDKTDLPIDPPDLKQYFKDIEDGKRKLQDLLRCLLIRRTRIHLLKWGYAQKDDQGRCFIIIKEQGTEIRKYFPEREKPITLEYSIEKTYKGLYNQICGIIGKPRKFGRVDFRKLPEEELTYARYGLWNYVQEGKKRKAPYTDLQRAGRNLRGLLRVMLFKRLESSVYAFRESIKRMTTLQERFLISLNENIIPAGEEAEYILYESDQYDESQLIDELRRIKNEKYNVEDFEIDKLKEDLEKDINLYKKMYSLVKDINADNKNPEQDDKLYTLIQRLKNDKRLKNKVLIFTQYAETAKYLYKNLNPEGKQEIESIDSTAKNRSDIINRFSPKANEYSLKNNEREIRLLVSTDVLAEGLNLQDCDNIINYDLHWNPVRLIQRIGRIDRIGSENEKIYTYNFLPETELDKNLGLHEKLRSRIQEIHNTIGEDAEILDKSEQLNEEAMYAIYEGNQKEIDKYGEEEDLIGITEAEEIIRDLQLNNPAYFNYITNLRDGVRSCMPKKVKGKFIFCQAGNFQQIFLASEEGKIISRDVSQVLAAIKCSEKTETKKLPQDHNRIVMKIKKVFEEEVKIRESEKEYMIKIGQAQRYVLRELRLQFAKTDDEDEKEKINVLEKTFRYTLYPAVIKELNLIRRTGITGEALLKRLSDIYFQYNLSSLLDSRDEGQKEPIVPKIICSESLI